MLGTVWGVSSSCCSFFVAAVQIFKSQGTFFFISLLSTRTYSSPKIQPKNKDLRKLTVLFNVTDKTTRRRIRNRDFSIKSESIPLLKHFLLSRFQNFQPFLQLSEMPPLFLHLQKPSCEATLSPHTVDSSTHSAGDLSKSKAKEQFFPRVPLLQLQTCKSL